jgi:ribosomal 50S subunit-associated protein YjgA (DUF615 family)
MPERRSPLSAMKKLSASRGYPSFKQQWLQQLPQNVQSTSETISPPQKSFRELFQRL